MRDDLHKGAPLPSRWRSFLRACTRDADWEAKAPRVGHNALAGEVRDSIDSTLIAALKAAETQPVLASDLLPSAAGPVNQLLLQHYRRMMNDPQERSKTEAAVACALMEVRDSMLREAQAHVLRKSAKDLPEVSRRMNSASTDTEIREIAREAVNSASPKNVAVNQPVDLEENLLRGGRR